METKDKIMQKKIMISRGDLIYKNPDTKQGRESYVRWDDRAVAWVFDFGQAYSTMKFRKDINDAINDMRDCSVFGKNKIPAAVFQERIPTCWFCGRPADNHRVITKMGKTITDYWTCDDHRDTEEVLPR